jgi:hypothetical protein
MPDLFKRAAPDAGGLPVGAWFGSKRCILTGVSGVAYIYRPLKHGGTGECDVFTLEWDCPAGHLRGRFWTDEDYSPRAGGFPLAHLEQNGQPQDRLITGPASLTDPLLRRAFIRVCADLRELDLRYRAAHQADRTSRAAHRGRRAKALIQPRTP